MSGMDVEESVNVLGLGGGQCLYSCFKVSLEIEVLAVTTELSLVLDCDTPMIFKLVPSQGPDQVIKALTFDLEGGAKAIGKPKAFRAVANAVGKNPYPPKIPCHRVIRSDGSLGGYSGKGGIQQKRRLLRSEKVFIK